MAAYLIYEAGEMLDRAAMAEYFRRVPAYLAQGPLDVWKGITRR